MKGIKLTDISQIRALIMVGCGVVFSLLTAGLIFGYAALKPIYINEGVYSWLCPSNSTIQPGKPLCIAQSLRLDLMFSISSALTNVFCLPIGMTLDYYGPRISGCIGSCIFFLGCLLMAISCQHFDAYIVGYLLLSLGGPYLFVSSMHLSNLFPARSGLILTMITGAFDASSGIFYIFQELHDLSGLSSQTMFLFYLIIPIVIFLVCLILMPDSQYQKEEVESCDRNKLSYCYSLRDSSLKSQFQTAEYWLCVIFISIAMVRLNFLIATVREQVDYYDQSSGASMARLFSIMLPLGGIVAIGPIGWFIDKYGTISAQYLVGAMTISFGVFNLFFFNSLQIIGFLIFVVMRPLIYTACSHFVGCMYGFSNFGKLYGIGVLVQGLINFIQYLFDDIVKVTLNGNFLTINILLTIVSIVSLVFPILLTIRNNSDRNKFEKQPLMQPIDDSSTRYEKLKEDSSDDNSNIDDKNGV